MELLKIKIRLTLFILFLITLPNSYSVTLIEAYKSALTKTETQKISKNQLEQSSLKEAQLKGELYPKVSANLGYDITNTTSSNKKYDGRTAYGKMAITQSLYEGGKDQAALLSSQLNSKALEKNIEVTQKEVFLNVAYAFYSVLTNEVELKNVQKSLDLTTERINELTKQIKIGKSKNIEVLSVKSQYAVLQSQLVAINGQLTSARENFSFVTGLPSNTSLNGEKNEIVLIKKLDTHLAQLNHRPDIELLNLKLESSKALTRVAYADYYPSINLNGSYFPWRSGAQEDTKWDIGVVVSIPIFSGDITSSKVQESKIKEMENELIIQKQERLAEKEIRTAYSNLNSISNQITALESALNITEQNYNEQKKDYRFSQATNLEVLGAMNTFLDTKRALDKMRIQLKVAEAELAAATNDLPK